MKLHFQSYRSFCLASVVGIALLGLLLSACAPQNPGTTPGTPVIPNGTLAGDVVAGPTCPVAQAENPCPPKAVPDREVMVKTADGQVVATAITDTQGHFSVSVTRGTYVVEVSLTPGFGLRQTQVVHVIVLAGQTAYVKIELDTGIR
jgi:hypothetical protein